MKKMARVVGWLALGWTILLLGCVASNDDVRILDNETLRLNSQVNMMQKEMQGMKRDSSDYQRDVQALRKDLQNDQKRDTAALKAELGLRIENLQGDFRVLSSGVEEYKELLKRPSKDADRVKEEIASRTRMLEERAKNVDERNRAIEERNRVLEERLRAAEERFRIIDDRLKGMDGKIEQVASRQTEQARDAVREKEKEPTVEAKAPSTGAGNLYNDAYQSFQRGDLDASRRKFESFLKQYPNTELSDNAQFWIAETYYQKKDFERAILEYEKVISKYPEGDKVSAALFKQALAFSELGDRGNARNLLRRVIEKYPQSEQAEMARKRLETLK
jgi:tol-pal system protein YbgF